MGVQQYRILIVDDSPEDRQTFSRRMASNGPSEPRCVDAEYQFFEAASGERGIELCRQQPIDCVLLDYSLPDLDGLQFLNQLHGEHGGDKIAVVMFTGHGNEEIAVQALKQGAQDYLVKGRINGDDIRRAVHAAIDKLALQRQIEEQRLELERRAAALRDSEQRYRLLLREVHHRVKNNLQLITSLLNLQAGYVKDPHASGMFRETQQRVRCMAAIHEALYCTDDLGRIDFSAYVRNLAADLVRLYEGHSRNLQLKPHICPLFLDMDTAIPCGLILHELISNCFKHAYPPNTAGEIDVEVSHQNEQLTLSVRDHGIGLPADFDHNTASSLGVRLVRALTRQLDGAIEFHRDNPGTRVRLTFRERPAL